MKLVQFWLNRNSVGVSRFFQKKVSMNWEVSRLSWNEMSTLKHVVPTVIRICFNKSSSRLFQCKWYGTKSTSLSIKTIIKSLTQTFPFSLFVFPQFHSFSQWHCRDGSTSGNLVHKDINIQISSLVFCFFVFISQANEDSKASYYH